MNGNESKKNAMTDALLGPLSHPRLHLYNTETRQKEELSPLDGQTIRMYTCGPTVYNFAHIGNFRTYVFEDLLRRSLQFFGFTVRQAMNITDIDDKTIKGAIARKVSLNEFTEPFKEAFFEDLKTLHIEPVEHILPPPIISQKSSAKLNAS